MIQAWVYVLTLIGFATLCSVLAEHSPPQPNPNQHHKHAVSKWNTSDPHPLSDTFSNTNGISDDVCDLKAIVGVTNETVVDVVKKSNVRCILHIGTTGPKQAKSACRDSKMKAVANAFAESASKYQPDDPSKTPELENYVAYLRICYFLSFHGHGHGNGGKVNQDLLVKVRSGLDTFLKQPNIDAQNDDHYRIAFNVIRLISNSRDSMHYINQLSNVFVNLSSTWNFTSQEKYTKLDQSDVVNAIFQVFFFSHMKKNEKQAGKYYCDHPEVPQAINDFMDKHEDLLNTTNEYLLRNAGGELARFLKYKCLTEKVDGYVEHQLKQYNATDAPKVWLTLVFVANHYSKTKKYGGGKFRVNTALEQQTLRFRKDCGKVYADTFIIRAQTMTDSAANEICTKLRSHESYFHNLVKDSWRPVTPDVNNKIEVVIFNNVNDYKYYANMIFGADTNNGGIYLEGDASRAGNVARYFCYKQGNSVWNLEHEFTHYLDGRYDMKGNFGDYNGGRRIWWLEGFAQYAAYKNNYPSQSQLCKAQRYSLSQIFDNRYGMGQDRIYDYGYLAARFMFEKHRSDVDTILRYFRNGQYSQYESWFAGIYRRYDQEFKSWCRL